MHSGGSWGHGRSSRHLRRCAPGISPARHPRVTPRGQRPTHADQHHHLLSSPNSQQGQLPVVPMKTRLRTRHGLDIVQRSVQSRDLLLHDEKALTADNPWSSCMATHGYQYDSWVDAPAKFLLPGSEVSTREFEQATVDAQCRDTNDFERLLSDAETVIHQRCTRRGTGGFRNTA